MTRIERLSKNTVLRKTYEKGLLVRAEILHHGKRRGWRLQPYRYDPSSLAYMSSDGLGAYIHSGGEVSYYDAWSDGERSSRRIEREAWIEECLEDMRRDAKLLGPRKQKRTKKAAVCPAPAPAPANDVRDLNNEAHVLIEARELEAAKRSVAKARAKLDARGELVVDKANLQNVHDWYFHLQRVLQIAWAEGKYEAHREDAARCYVLENALVLLTSTWNRDDPKGPRIADERFVHAYGLWAIVSFQTRTKHFDAAERLLAAELDSGGLAVRLHARRELAETTINGLLCAFTENPERERAIARARPTFDAIAKLVGEPETGLLAHQLACFHAFYGEKKRALDLVARAVQLGRPRRELETDPDLAALFTAA